MMKEYQVTEHTGIFSEDVNGYKIGISINEEEIQVIPAIAERVEKTDRGLSAAVCKKKVSELIIYADISGYCADNDAILSLTELR